jgi:hypothetical protein
MSCSCCEKMNAYIWANQRDMMRYDHTKPAPCISANTLMYIRLSLAAVMLGTTVYVIIVTKAQSLVYLSQWSLLLTTLNFGQLAYVQILTYRKRREGVFLEDEDVLVSHDPTTLNVLDKPYQSYKWTVFLYQLAFSLNCVVFVFFYYILIFDVGSHKNVIWWDSEDL